MRHSEGDQVWHPGFGAGVITARDAADPERLIVSFRDVGTRKLRAGSLGSRPGGLDRPKSPEVSASPVTSSGRQLGIVTADAFAGKAVPHRQWHVEQLIPAKTVTILAGDGGTGKSLLATQLAIATATGSSWIGLPVATGPVLYLSAEDDLEELHRRIATICELCRLDVSSLVELSIVPLAGEDALLASPDGRGNVLRTSPLFASIDTQIAAAKPKLVVLDTLADLFGGDENQRAQSRQFISLLRGWAIRHSVTILLLAHPSLSGLASGTGTSGNTAWNNSVRSRLYLERVATREDGKVYEPDPDARILRTVKANYGRVGGEIPLRWIEGVLEPNAHSPTSISEQLLAEGRTERVFMTLLTQFEAEGRNVSPIPSAPTYAPTNFAKHIKAEGITKRGFETAMNRLFTAQRIRVGRSAGPPSRQRDIIVRVISGEHV